MKKSIGVIIGFISLVMVSLAFTAAEEPHYKNLKVLPKNTNKKQMDSIMHHFSQSLGVKCNFCHVFNQEQKSMDFASDANEHKGVARMMMKMTNGINKRYFHIKDVKNLSTKLEVTCYTCHNGKEEPAHVPAFMPRGPGGPGPGPGPMIMEKNADSTKRP